MKQFEKPNNAQISIQKKRRVISEIMPRDWTPSKSELDLTGQFLNEDDSCTLHEIILQVRNATIPTPLGFFVQETRDGSYYKITILYSSITLPEKKPEKIPEKKLKRFSMSSPYVFSNPSFTTNCPICNIPGLSKLMYFCETCKKYICKQCSKKITSKKDSKTTTRICISCEKDMKDNATQKYKIVVLGGYAVGKSSIIHRCLYNEHSEEHDATIEDTYQKKIVQENNTIKLNIFDTGGEEQLSKIFMDGWIRGNDGFLLVYDVTKKGTFDKIIEIHDMIMDLLGEQKIACLLVGNKSDLSHKDREVSYQDGKDMSLRFDCPFYETSAKKPVNCENIFLDIIKQIHLLKYLPKQKRKIKSRHSKTWNFGIRRLSLKFNPFGRKPYQNEDIKN